MNRMLLCISLLISSCFSASAQFLSFPDSATLFLPGIVSTKNADVKITFSPDGKKMLWGGIDWIPGKKDFDIWESHWENGKWSKPVAVSFNSDSNDFDPFFSYDGKGIYFFSNRAGGFGKDDLYFVTYDHQRNIYDQPVNLGPNINTAGNEWAPVTDRKNEFLYFSSDGRGGFGKQDLFSVRITPNWDRAPGNLGAAINSADDDFDAIVLNDETIVFTSTRQDHETAALYAWRANPRDLPVQLLPAHLINASGFWTFGPSIHPLQPGYLYFSGHLHNNEGRTDIYKIRFHKIYP